MVDFDWKKVNWSKFEKPSDSFRVLKRTEEKDKLITEDDLEKGRKQIDDITKECTDKVDEMIKHKSDEILLD